MSDPETQAADRLSAALSELGEAAINMIKVEREACAMVVQNMVDEAIRRVKAKEESEKNNIRANVLVAAVLAIRTRQPD